MCSCLLCLKMSLVHHYCLITVEWKRIEQKTWEKPLLEAYGGIRPDSIPLHLSDLKLLTYCIYISVTCVFWSSSCRWLFCFCRLAQFAFSFSFSLRRVWFWSSISSSCPWQAKELLGHQRSKEHRKMSSAKGNSLCLLLLSVPVQTRWLLHSPQSVQSYHQPHF